MRSRTIFWMSVFILLMNGFVQAQTPINGLVALVDYQGYPFLKSADSVSFMLNQSGFNAWGNQGSVRDFYLVQSNHKIALNSQVVRVSLPHAPAYYHGKNLGYDGGQLFASDVLAAINQLHPQGFQDLTSKAGEPYLRHFSIISRVPEHMGHGVAFGLSTTQYIKNNGQDMPVNNVALIGYEQEEEPTISVIAHEFGHSVFDWTDYYVPSFSNLGNFCVMASAGDKTPFMLSAPLRYMKGWTQATEISGTVNQTVVLTANDYQQVYKYTNPNNTKEYLILTALKKGGYYLPSVAVDEGLAIFYVDEDGGINSGGIQTSAIVKLIQADKLNEMDDDDNRADVRGDANDLFDQVSNIFSSATHPFRWKDGGETGLTVSNISAPGSTMSFVVQGRNNTLKVQPQVITGGTIFPRGVLSTNGSPITFNIKPDPGYDADKLYIDGQLVGNAPASYTYTLNGNHTLQVTFKKNEAKDPILAPWQKAQIGSTSVAGSAHMNATDMVLESGGSDIWGTYDNFEFVYQPLYGDGEIVARVKGMNNAMPWSKAGVMIRESLDPQSKFAMMVSTPLNSLSPQYRESTGGGANANPQDIRSLNERFLYTYLKVTRTGSTLKGFCSRNGIDWIELMSVTISMNQQVYLGLCVSGASAVSNSRAYFDNIKVNTGTVTNLFSRFNVPRTTALPSISKSFRYVYTIGTGGPNLSQVNNAFINWDNASNKIWAFSVNTSNGVPAWYVDFMQRVTYSLKQSSPTITFNGSTGINGLAGTYYVTLTNNDQDLVLVSQNGQYALLFTNTAQMARTGDLDVQDIENTFAIRYLSPFVTETTVSFLDSAAEANVLVFDLNGKLMGQTTATGSFRFGAEMPSGMYLVTILINGHTETLKLIKE